MQAEGISFQLDLKEQWTLYIDGSSSSSRSSKGLILARPKGEVIKYAL